MYILFDIGGTNMRLAFSKDGESLHSQKSIPTPSTLDEGVLVFSKIVRELSHGHTLKAAAGGLPGSFSGSGRDLRFRTPNLPGWSDRPLLEKFEKALSIPFFFENDCDLIGLGEATYGAGKDAAIVVYITVSTGIGRTRIVDKKIDRNVMGFEPGHQIIDVDGTTAADGSRKDLEELIGGGHLERRFGKRAADIDDPRVWNETARLLACGLHNATVFWSPHMIILGGSVMKSINIEKVRQELKKMLTIFPEPPVIVSSALGENGGFYGALAYLHQKTSGAL